MGDSSVSHAAKSGSPTPSGWVELTGGDFPKVTFIGVKQQYTIGEDIVFHVQLVPGDVVCKWDRVTLTAFGKTREPTYISLIGLDSAGVSNLEVKFAQNVLPKNTEFYQFLYLRGNVVLGASPPFFLQASQDDALSVSSEDDFLVVHQVGEKDNRPQEPPRKQQEIYASSCFDEGCSALTELSDATDSTSTTSDSTAAASVNSADSKPVAAPGEPKSDSGSNSRGGLFPGISRKENIGGDAPSDAQAASKIRTSEWLQQWCKQMPPTPMKDMPARNPAAEKLFGTDKDKPIISALQLVIKKEKEKNEMLTQELVNSLHLNDCLKDELSEKDDIIKALKIAVENEKKAREMSLKEVIGLTCTKNVMELELKEKTSKIDELKQKQEDLKNAKLEIPPCMACTSKDTELQSLKATLETEKEDNAFSKEKVQSYSHSVKTLKIELQDKAAKIEHLVTALEEGQKDREILMEQVSNLTRENDMLHSEHDRKVSLSSSSCSDHLRDIEDAETMLYALEASKALAVQEIKSQKVMEGKLRSAVDNMRVEYDMLNKKLQEMKEHIEELRELEAVLREDNESLKAKERVLEQRVKALSQGQSCKDYDVDKAVTVEGMQLRLAQAAAVYKKQFIEIRSLKKQLRKLQKSQQRVLNGWRDGLPGPVEWRNLADETTSSSAVSQRSDSDTGEFIKVMNAHSALSASVASGPTLAEPRPTQIRMEAYQMQAAAAAMSVGIPPHVRASAPPYTSEFDMLQSMASENVAEPPTDKSVKQASKTIDEGSTQSIKLNSCGETVAPSKSDANATVETSMGSVNTINCPYCDKELQYVDDKLSPLIEHLNEKHDQLVCPVCGISYDSKLPIDYFQMHVESHFDEK